MILRLTSILFNPLEHSLNELGGEKENRGGPQFVSLLSQYHVSSYLFGHTHKDRDLYDIVGDYKLEARTTGGSGEDSWAMTVKITDKDCALVYPNDGGYFKGIILVKAVIGSHVDLSKTKSAELFYSDDGKNSWRSIQKIENPTERNIQIEFDSRTVGSGELWFKVEIGIDNGKTYYYKVKAYDLAGNESGLSNVAFVATDTQPPPPFRLPTDLVLLIQTWPSFGDPNVISDYKKEAVELLNMSAANRVDGDRVTVICYSNS